MNRNNYYRPSMIHFIILILSVWSYDFESLTVINGIDHKIVCNCVRDPATDQESWLVDTNVEDNVGLCNPGSSEITLEKSVSIIQNNQQGNLSVKEEDRIPLLSKTYGEPRYLTRQPIAQASFQCTDSRNRVNGQYFYGGDFGLILIYLSILDSYTTLTQENIDNILLSYSSLGYDLNYCTDEVALSLLKKHLDTPTLDLSGDIDKKLQDNVITLLTTNPSFHGDLLLRSILDIPSNYAIKPDTLHMAIRSLFAGMWQDKIQGQIIIFSEIRDESPILVIIHEANTCPSESTLINPFEIRKAGLPAEVLHIESSKARLDSMSTLLRSMFSNTIEDHNILREHAHERLELWIANMTNLQSVYSLQYTQD